MKHLYVTAAILAAMACSVCAEDAKSLSVIIYKSGVSMIEDTRAIDFPKGRSSIVFPGISARIKPETATLTADGVTTIEQNFDYDLLTPKKLMEKSLGETVTLVRTNPGTGAQTEEPATVLSTQEGVVIKVGGRIEVLRDDGIPTRVIFDKIPENLRAKPTLSILASSGHAGTRPTSLKYMTTGLTWRADYVANFDEKTNTVDLQSWVTLNNDTSARYEDARVRVTAASIGGNLAGNVRAATNDTNQLAYFDLPGLVTIADRQEKQIGMADLKQIHAEKIYHVTFQNVQAGPTKADVAWRFNAIDQNGSALRLPGGTLRAFIKDAKGDAQFIGESQLQDIPGGGEILATVSKAFDIQITPKIISQEGNSWWGKASVEYKVANASMEPVAVEVEQTGLYSPIYGQMKITSESIASKAIDAFRRSWIVDVPARGETTLAVSFGVQGN